MLKLLFSPDGRITRGQFWSVALVYIAASALVGGGLFALWTIIPGTVGENGEFSVDGAKAVPYLLLVFGYMIFCVWSGICVSAKRLHDRNKSGWWMLIQFIPIVGAIWYLIEVGFRAGTLGPNRFGQDPLAPAVA